MKKLPWLIVAIALIGTGIESIRILAEWWQAGVPALGMEEALAFAALALIAFVGWRCRVFGCGSKAKK
ncbi:MAG: hypothetical protein KJ787_11255 [Gammaproteobacteria bacterium]|nr:hypothetical protein [Gammaproteobacteria bacterium]MBU1646898.1 hypothetical protein [Gammaproteobacteria bacterium]MBU1971159.1 hypothetical protein [Gammaproteobacteria bacterium]